jgi:hypothetical protein
MPVRPTFLLDLTFTDLAEWCLRLECCGRTVCLPFRFLVAQKLRGRLGDLILALQCRDCGQRPPRVVLVDDAADGAYGRLVPRGWRIEIVLPNRNHNSVR